MSGIKKYATNRKNYCVNCNEVVNGDMWRHTEHKNHRDNIIELGDPVLCHEVVETILYNNKLERYNHVFERCRERVVDGHFVLHPKIKCGVCGDSIKHGSIDSHFSGHFGLTPYPCPYCMRSFASPSTSRKHTRKHETFAKQFEMGIIGYTWDGESFHCANCELSVISKTDMGKHACDHTPYYPRDVK